MANAAMVPSAEVRSFRQLMVWQKAMDLATVTYRAAASLPDYERFGLARELRRSVTSIPSNVAEGFNRHSRGAYRAHVAIALGSAAELETQIELARRLSYLSDAESATLLDACGETARLLQGLWRALSQG